MLISRLLLDISHDGLIFSGGLLGGHIFQGSGLKGVTVCAGI